jgi:hypothetical protein
MFIRFRFLSTSVDMEIDGDFDPDFGCTVLIANNDATGGTGVFTEMPLPPHATASRQFENIVAEAIVSQLLAPSDENETSTSRVRMFSNGGMSLNP